MGLGGNLKGARGKRGKEGGWEHCDDARARVDGVVEVPLYT